MIITIGGEKETSLDRMLSTLTEWGVQEIITCRIGGSYVLLVPEGDSELAERVRSVASLERVIYPPHGTTLADRANFASDTIVEIGDSTIGGETFTVAAGPCAVESYEQVHAAAQVVQAAGASILRGGAFKPRTSAYSFQGMGWDGLRVLAQVRDDIGLPIVSEVLDPRAVDAMAGYVDMFQIGTRNAQNFALLKEVGQTGLPVLLKRGFGCTIEEWLGAAEYVLLQGDSRVVMCERGIRTFETGTRFTLDLAAVPLVKQRTHLPVIVDPSHGTGHKSLVIPMALAAAAAGADGLLVDVHTDKSVAKCDGAQALSGLEFRTLMDQLSLILPGLGRKAPDLVDS